VQEFVCDPRGFGKDAFVHARCFCFFNQSSLLVPFLSVSHTVNLLLILMAALRMRALYQYCTSNRLD
jgi:hypothetical protein